MRAITTFAAFGVSVIVGLAVPLVTQNGNLPNPVTGGFSTQEAGALLTMGLLVATMTFAFTPILAAEILVVKAGNLKTALEILTILGMLTGVLLLVVMNGPLIAISFVVSLPFAAALSSKIPVQTKKQKQDRWTRS